LNDQDDLLPLPLREGVGGRGPDAQTVGSTLTPIPPPAADPDASTSPPDPTPAPAEERQPEERRPIGRSPDLLHSAGFRFAMVYAGLLAVSAAALAFYLWWATAGLLDRQTEAAIHADAQGLSERWAEGRLPLLVLTIRERLEQNVDDDALYLLVNSDLQPLAGNLRSWPAGVDDAGQPYELRVTRAGAQTVAQVQRYDLPDGYHLLIGRDVQARVKLRQLLADALLWGLVVVAVMALAGAFIVRSLFRRTLANVSATAAAISSGDFSRRVRVSGRGDEFDQLAETINDMLDRIARLMEGVRQVSNAIAHDLRTPITRARARLEDAALHAATPGELHAAIERATGDLDGIVAVFQALLRISEIEAGSRRAAFTSLDVAAVLADVAELYDPLAEEKGLRLTLDAPSIPPIHGDPEMLRQAVTNLTDNAVKFSPPGGEVRLSAIAVPSGVEITVADQGPGIPPEDRSRATERFFRGEAARSTPGSGLGLALVQAVALLHGGTLRLEDADPGLRATLSLPANG
ncbi:MAG TPA: HAMP domain-containing sensor histidine kinase, partial [Acetobacteraceae bacterium]|nr:HAMP domain-containing sensor histidine kinase [Acetobacteraceae bacterium]